MGLRESTVEADGDLVINPSTGQNLKAQLRGEECSVWGLQDCFSACNETRGHAPGSTMIEIYITD